MRQRDLPYRFIFILGLLVMIGINGWSAMLHPDGTINGWQSIASVVWLVGLVGSLFYIKEDKALRLMVWYIRSGLVAALFIYGVSLLGGAFSETIWFDGLASVQFIFYFLFVIPLFGLNAWTDVLFGEFSLYMSVLYGIALITLHVKVWNDASRHLNY